MMSGPWQGRQHPDTQGVLAHAGAIMATPALPTSSDSHRGLARRHPMGSYPVAMG